MYAEKVAARYDPTAIQCGGLNPPPPPPALSTVGKYGIELKWN